jgi:hypothetical protein
MESKKGLQERVEALEAAFQAEMQTKKRLAAAFETALDGETKGVEFNAEGKRYSFTLPEYVAGAIELGRWIYSDGGKDAINGILDREQPPDPTVGDLINALGVEARKYGGRVYRFTDNSDPANITNVKIICGSMKTQGTNFRWGSKDWGFVWQKLK